MKRRVYLAMITIIFAMWWTGGAAHSLAQTQSEETQSEETSAEEWGKDLWTEINGQMQTTDLSKLEEIMEDIPKSVRQIWGDQSVSSLLKQMFTGEEVTSNDKIIPNLWEIVREALRERIALVLAILTIGILGGILGQVKGVFGSGTNEMAGFVCFVMGMLIAVAAFTEIVLETRKVIQTASNVMSAVFPILYVLLTGMGLASSAGLMQPATALLTTGMSALADKVLIPMLLIMGVLAVIGNFSDNAQLKRMQKFVQSTAKWLTGGATTVFIGIVTIRSIGAKAKDSLSLRAARFAMDRFIPYVGSLLSGSVDAALSAAEVIKSGVGLCGMLLMVGVLIVPLIRIAALQLSFRLTAALVELIGDKRLAQGIDQMAGALTYLFAIVAIVGLMFMIATGVLISMSIM